jgi:hypothetical protein
MPVAVQAGLYFSKFATKVSLDRMASCSQTARGLSSHAPEGLFFYAVLPLS